METVIRRLRIRNLKAQVALRKLIRESLAKEFEAALSVEDRAVFAQRADSALKEQYVLQLMVDLLERQERETAQFLEPATGYKWKLTKVPFASSG